MDDKRYYDFLNHGIEWKDKPNINGHGFYTSDRIPFLKAGDAVKHVITHYPEAEPNYLLIKENPVLCRELVKTIEPELRRLLGLLESNIEERNKEIDSLVEQRNSLSDRNLLESVQKKVLTDEIIRKGGEFSGVIFTTHMIRDRLLEFINISSMKGG